MRSEEEIVRFIREQRSEGSFGELPLKDVRVIDMATVLAGPFAATVLGDFGADVIKVENPALPDATRGWGVLEDGVQPFWAVFGRNKFPVTINLKSGDGKRVFLELVAKSDVLIENMRPGTMEKLGLNMETLLKSNPGLVVGRLSGYGQTGPYASKPGFGTLAEGLSGFTYLNAHPDGPPTNPPLALADFVAGLHLAIAVLIGLRDRKRGLHGGKVIDISLYEPLFGLFGADFLGYSLSGEIPQPRGNELSYVVPRNNYKTGDGKWVALSCSSQKPFERLMEAAGHPEMNDDPRFSTNAERIKEENRRVINRVISEWIGSKDQKEILELCDHLGITVGPIATVEEIAENPHYRERKSWIEIEDPVTERRLRMPDVPFRMPGYSGKIRFPGLPVGIANAVIYQDLLGYRPDEIEEFKKAGTI